VGGDALLLLPLKTYFTAPNADCPSVFRFADWRQARMNPSHHGSDEQMVGAAQQVLHLGLVN
jgi:hypothetical protein